MKRVMILACLALAAIGAYFFVLKPSPKERLQAAISDSIGQDGEVGLEGCNLSILVETEGQPGSAIALTRLSQRIDLRLYNWKTARAFPFGDVVNVRVDRASFNDRMLSQFSDIADQAGEQIRGAFTDADAMRRLLETDGGSMSFQVNATIVEEDGKERFIAHEDAPEFYNFVKAVEALSAPISYRAKTVFAPGGVSADTLLIGNLVAVPPLHFSVASKSDAQRTVRAFNDYSRAEGCQ